MWVITTEGFFSAVEDRDDPGAVFVRARVRDDAERLAAAVGGSVIETPAADYRFRVRTTKREWAAFVAASAEAIDYYNFKNAVAAPRSRSRPLLRGSMEHAPATPAAMTATEVVMSGRAGFRAAAFIRGSTWVFAKTLPEPPNEYTVRDLPSGERSTCQSDESFEWFVEHIREHGERRRYGRSWYVSVRDRRRRDLALLDNGLACARDHDHQSGARGARMLTERFTEALEYARAHHEEDLRKGTEIPYLAHLLAICSIVLENGGGETEALGALLHDIVEDGGGIAALQEIEQRFGADVAAIVKGCSDTTAAVKEDWRLRKERYLAHLESAPSPVLLVSAADKLHNARSIRGDLREHGDELWQRFNRGPREQLWYYGALRDAFVRRLPGRLTDELDRTVREINRMVPFEDRVEYLGRPFELWSYDEGDEVGAIVDWPGCPLVVRAEPGALLVCAHVGSGGDYCPDADEDLDDLIETELGDLRLEYVEPDEVAWLVAEDQGDLREACERVARAAQSIAAELGEAISDLDPPISDYAERLDRGPR